MRLAIVGAAAAALVAAALWSHFSGSPRAAALRELERLAPAAKAPACAPASDEAQALAAAMALDRGCQWLKASPGAGARKLADAAGGEGVPFLGRVVAACPFEAPGRPACAALDALFLRARGGDEAALRALHAARADASLRREVRLSALLRALSARPPATAELVQLIEREPGADARADLVSVLRPRRDAAARPALERLYATASDHGLRSQLRAALLELDHPGDCVTEDDGRGSGNLCVYSCPGEAARRAIQRPANVSCPATFAP